MYYFRIERTYDKAIEAFSERLRLDPDDLNAARNFGQLYSDQWVNLMVKGTVQLIQGDFLEAEKDYRNLCGFEESAAIGENCGGFGLSTKRKFVSFPSDLYLLTEEGKDPGIPGIVQKAVEFQVITGDIRGHKSPDRNGRLVSQFVAHDQSRLFKTVIPPIYFFSDKGNSHSLLLGVLVKTFRPVYQAYESRG
jgi:tetratricopeptide (TPR) repeat protein